MLRKNYQGHWAVLEEVLYGRRKGARTSLLLTYLQTIYFIMHVINGDKGELLHDGHLIGISVCLSATYN